MGRSLSSFCSKASFIGKREREPERPGLLILQKQKNTTPACFLLLLLFSIYVTSGNREMPRISGSPPQTHQGGLLSSIDMAVAVCWGCPRCNARWGTGDTSVPAYGCATARERASEQRTSKRASRERAMERIASERASVTQQTDRDAQRNQCVGVWQSESGRTNKGRGRGARRGQGSGRNRSRRG